MATFLTKPQDSNAAEEQSSKALVRFGVVGYGYWGPKVIRNLDLLEETEVSRDLRQERRCHAGKRRRRTPESSSPTMPTN